MRLVYLLLIAFMFTACQSETETKEAAPEPATLSEKIDQLIEADEYEEALTLLEAEEVSEEILGLQEKTHLNYGLFIIYNSDPSKMRENANNGLRQFIKVLDINRGNDKAVSEIEQIMGIYATFPDRGPDEDVMEDLRRLGFNY